MRLTIHIGTSKTGTTALQKSLFNSVGSLSEAGVYVDHHTRHLNLLGVLVQDESRWSRGPRSWDDERKARAPDDALAVVERLRQAAADPRYTDAIISAEHLWRFSRTEVTRFIDVLDLPQTDIQIACYVRRPSRHWLSAVQQTLKASGGFPAPINYRYRVDEQLENWQSDPRIRKLIVRPFDREQLVGGSVISDFMNHVVPGADLLPAADLSANEGMTAEAAILQQRYRSATHRDQDDQFTSVGRRVLRAILEASRDVPGTPLTAHSTLLDLVDHRHVERLRWLAANHGVELIPADELDRLEALDIDAHLGRETLVEQICSSFDQGALDQLSHLVMHRLAGGEKA